jgi:uncharacterized protein (TIGR02996 family)
MFRPQSSAMNTNGTSNGRANGTPRRKKFDTNPTGRYVPAPAWWGYGSAALDNAPVFTWWDVPRMLRDPQVRFLERMWRAPFQRVKWQVRCENPRAAKWADKVLRKFWRGSLPRLLSRYFRFGYSAGGAEYCPHKGFVRFERVRTVEPRDAHPLVWTSGPEVGHFAGFKLGNNAAVTGRPDAATTWVGSPHAFWFSGHQEYGPYYDTPPLSGLFEPWLEKRGRGGAVHIRRGWFRRCAFQGGIMHVPEGTSPLGADESSQTVDNQDLARQTLEYGETGSVYIFTNEVNPANPSVYAWDYTEPRAQADIAGVRDYPKDLDEEMAKGIGITPEVLEAADVGSGWSGRLIPLMGFLGGVDELAGLVIEAAMMWLRPAVEVNFGRAWLEVEPFSLAEEVQAQAKAGKGGTEGENPIPGLLGRQPSQARVMSWAAYEGPHGGRGWRNAETGEVRYQETNPEAEAAEPHADTKAKRIIRFLKGLPKRVVAKAREKVRSIYQKLEKRYGPGYAKVIISGVVAGLPIPLPGMSVAISAPMLAVAELHRQLSRWKTPEPGQVDAGIVRPATEGVLARLLGRGRQLSDDRGGQYEDEQPEPGRPESERGRGEVERGPVPTGESTHSHSEDEFHRRIHEDPAEGMTALTYADWLEEQGRPAHAAVVRQHAERVRKVNKDRAATTAGRIHWDADLDGMSDPDIPWETGISAQPSSNPSLPNHYQIRLHRRSLTPGENVVRPNAGSIISWGSDYLHRDEAAKLVRRLTAEARDRIPEEGEVLHDANAQNLARHGLPPMGDAVGYTYGRRAADGMPAHSAEAARHWAKWPMPQVDSSGHWYWDVGMRDYPNRDALLSAHPGIKILDPREAAKRGKEGEYLTPAELEEWKEKLREAGEPGEFHTRHGAPGAKEMSSTRPGHFRPTAAQIHKARETLYDQILEHFGVNPGEEATPTDKFNEAVRAFARAPGGGFDSKVLGNGVTNKRAQLVPLQLAATGKGDVFLRNWHEPSFHSRKGGTRNFGDEPHPDDVDTHHHEVTDRHWYDPTLTQLERHVIEEATRRKHAEKMGKGGDEDKLDWRPNEMLPEDYYAMADERGQGKAAFPSVGEIARRDADQIDPYDVLFPEEREKLLGSHPGKEKSRAAYQHMVRKGGQGKPGSLPTVPELKALAEVGEPVKGSYADTFQTMGHLLGDPADAHRWVTANAILSAQTGWEAHTAGAIEALAAWELAGRPRDKKSLDEVFGTTGRNDRGASVITRRGAFRGPDTLTGDKVDKLKELFADPDDPGVEWENISGGSLKTPNFGKAFVDPRGVPIDTHMAKLTTPEVEFSHADVRRIAAKGKVGKKTASDLLAAQKSLIEDKAAALAYKTLVAQAASEMGWNPNEVQESVWTAALAVMVAKHHGAANKADSILGGLNRQAIQAGWSLNTVLQLPGVVDDLKKLGISPRKLQKAIEKSQKRLPAGRGRPRTSDPAALEAGAQRLAAGVPKAGRPIERLLSTTAEEGERGEPPETT